MKARRWRSGALLGLVLAVALVAAGCGDDGDGDGSTETTAGAGAAPAVDEALAAKVPDAIKSDGKLLIGTDPTYAPNEFLDTDGKTVIGFDVDLFNAVAAKLGLETEWQPSKFADIIPGVQSAKYEAGVSSFTINDERKQQANMVSYFSAGTQWGTKTGNPSRRPARRRLRQEGRRPDRHRPGDRGPAQARQGLQERRQPGHHHRQLPGPGPGDRRGRLRQGRRHAGRLPGARLRRQADQRPARAAR